MPDALSILCIHGVGHGDADALLEPSWRAAIGAGIGRWRPAPEPRIDFLAYDDLFDHAPLNMAVYAEAFARLMASGAIHGIGETSPSSLTTGLRYGETATTPFTAIPRSVWR